MTADFAKAVQPGGLDHSPSFERFDPYNPILNCPPGQALARYGGTNDGGKVFCNISGLAPPCVVYSLGSNGDYSFENDVLRATKCDVHTFDCTYPGGSVDGGARHT